MKAERLAFPVALAVALIGNSSAAHAQANDAAAAQALFNEGKQLMTAKQYAAACPKFVESQRLDPGIGTMLWLADCHAKNNQLASAWVLFLEAEALATKAKDPRAAVAREEARKLEPKVSKLVIDASAVSGVEGVEIKRDGVALGQPLWGTKIPTDAGMHRITVTAPEHRSWEGEVTVPANAGAASIAIPALEPAPKPVEPVAAPISTEPVIDPRRGRGQRILGLVAGGVGLVGIGVGVFFGLKTGSTNEESRSRCRPDDPNLCDALGVSLRDDAKGTAMLSNVGFIAGGALLVGGAVLYFTAPKAPVKVGAAPVPGGGTFAVHGVF